MLLIVNDVNQREDPVQTTWTGRGGAAGSAAARRKATESRLPQGLEDLLKRYSAVDGSNETPAVAKAVTALKGLVDKTPTAGELLRSLEGVIRDLKKETSTPSVPLGFGLRGSLLGSKHTSMSASVTDPVLWAQRSKDPVFRVSTLNSMATSDPWI